MRRASWLVRIVTWRSSRRYDKWYRTMGEVGSVNIGGCRIGDMAVVDLQRAHVIKALEPIWSTKYETFFGHPWEHRDGYHGR
jgi:hypothetical protein